MVGKDGTVYYERAADEQVKIASITKVMTAIVALDNAPLDTTITVDHAAATVGLSSADLKEGDTMTLETALRALLIPRAMTPAWRLRALSARLSTLLPTTPMVSLSMP